MRETKKLPSVLLALVLFFTLSVPALAAAVIDPSCAVSLTISCRQDGTPISGAPFALYRVADIDAYAEFTLAGDFRTYPVRLDGLDSAARRALAETLAADCLARCRADAGGLHRLDYAGSGDLPRDEHAEAAAGDSACDASGQSARTEDAPADRRALVAGSHPCRRGPPADCGRRGKKTKDITNRRAAAAARRFCVLPALRCFDFTIILRGNQLLFQILPGFYQILHKTEKPVVFRGREG